MDPLISRLLSIEKSDFTFGLNIWTCGIKDTAEAKLFKIYKEGWAARGYLRHLGLFLFMVATEFGFLVAFGT